MAIFVRPSVRQQAKKGYLTLILQKLHDVVMHIFILGIFFYFLVLWAGKFTKQALNARNAVFTYFNACGLHR